LPLSGAQVFENTADVTSFSYDARKRQLVSYDTPHIAALKAKYVQANGLAGSMFWEVLCGPPIFENEGKCAETRYLAG
jgi:chitinase